MNGIGDLEYNIWQTSEGTNYVDGNSKEKIKVEGMGCRTNKILLFLLNSSIEEEERPSRKPRT